jgi:hypothetical protein
MRAIFGTVLLWLLMAAMPLQAFASANMPGCDRLNSSGALSASTGLDHDANRMMAPAGHHVCAMVGHSTVHHHSHANANSGCNCSPCCPPIASLAAPSVRLRDFGSRPIAFAAPYFPDFVPSLPERPPHTSLHRDTVKC